MTTQTVTLVAPAFPDDPAALTVTPAQAARLLLDQAGYAPDTTDACIETMGLDEGTDVEHGHVSAGGLTDLLDDGHPWALVPSDSDGPPYLQRMDVGSWGQVWVAIVAG